jgi:hypothetical protein
MKSLLSLMAVLAIVVANAAIACEGPQPPNCNCDNTSGQWVLNASASASASSQSKSSSSATGGNAAVSLNNSGNSSATGGAGGNATASIGKGAVQNSNNVAGGSVASGAVQNTVSNTVSVAGGPSTSHVGNVAASVGNVTSGSSNSSTDITYEAAKNYRNPVETAYSANLTSGMDTCLGSFSAGGQTQILGLTFGKTVTDKNCILIKQTKLLNENGLHRSACFRMQMDKEGALIKKAMQEAGETCPPMPFADDAVVIPTALPVDAVTHAELSEVERRITTKVTSK